MIGEGGKKDGPESSRLAGGAIDAPPPSAPPTSRPGSRREEIVFVATKLFSDKGYDGASMENLAQAVGLRKASLFHHFESKDALYAEVLGGLLSDVGSVIELAQRTEGPYLARLEAFADKMVETFGGRPHAAKLLFREAMDRGPIMRAWLGGAIQGVLGAGESLALEGKRLGHFAGMDSKSVVVSLVGVFFVPYVIDDVVSEFVGAPVSQPDALDARRKAVRAQLLALAGPATVT